MPLPERVTIDPIIEDASLVPLDLIGTDRGWGIYLMSHEYPPPELQTQTAGSADTDGDPVVQSRHGNRTINARVRIFEPSDAASTNLVPNPSAELATTGWSTSSGGWETVVFTREALPSLMQTNGTDYGLRLKAKHEASVIEKFLIAETKSGVEGMPVTPLTNYTWSFYAYFADPPVRTGGNTKSLWVSIIWYTGAGAEISQPIKEYAVAAGDFGRYSISAEAPGTAAFAKVRVSCDSNVSGDTVDVWIDRAQFEAATAATSYFDGDTPGCDWTAARHATSSTRPAPDGTRFSRIYRDLTRKLDAITRKKQATLRRIAPGFQPITFDLRSAKITDAPQDLNLGMKRAEIGLSFEADPGGRTAEVQVGGTREELTLPCLSFLAEGIPGDLPALGRLLVEDKSGVLQLGLWWGMQHDTYNASADAALFYEAESRTPKGGAATAALAGASGGGNNTVAQATLVPQYQDILSTQASGGGNHLAHVGSYRVLARIYRPTTNTGEVSVKLAYAQGDFTRLTENDAVVFAANDREGSFTITDLGIVDIEAPPSGTTPRWEGRIRVKSTVTGDDINIDCIFLVPVNEASGEAIAAGINPVPSQFVGLDSFEQAVEAVLAGQSAPVGGVYGGGGDAVDFKTSPANGYVTRSEISDAVGVGRYDWLAETKYTSIAIRARVSYLSNLGVGKETEFLGTFCRYVDTNNWLGAFLYPTVVLAGNAYWAVGVFKKVAGAKTLLGGIQVEYKRYWETGPIDKEFTLTAAGTGWQLQVVGPASPISGSDAILGTTLKEGRIGIYDEYQSAVASNPRAIYNLEAWEPVLDASIHASRQFELRDDEVRRQDPTGVAWGDPSYEGDYLEVPPDGPEKAPTRFIIKDSRDPNADAGIDDIAAKLYVKPRYLVAPPS